ncbi:hypothetical protein ACET3Z_032580 [Daucus carota]
MAENEIQPKSEDILNDEDEYSNISFRLMDVNDIDDFMVWATDDKYWGKGIVTRAVKKVASVIFAEWPHLERLEALVDVENAGSQRVLQKAGFQREGVLRKYVIQKGRTRDMYLAVLCRLLSLFADQATGALFFESWSSKFALNLLAFFLFSHVVGSFWYNFALDRVDKCLRKACGESWCFDYIYCEPRNLYWEVIVDATLFEKWTNNKNATACFSRDAYDYGIYVQAVSLMKNSNLLMRYIYSLFWGFQQISTLAGNQIPAFFLVEVLFTMFVTATGLLLFSFLIGNIQNFLQALGRRSLENSLRRSDIEQWMSHRQLPEDLKAKIRESEQYNWLATKGLNELMLLENLPEDLQRDIRRHLFKFDNKLPIVASMDESIKDAIRERMKHNTYIEGSRVLVRGGLMDKMVYIVQGKLESTSEGENVVPLSEGDVCGAELITLCLEHYVLNRDGDKFRIPAGKLVSKRTVRCITNVEAFTLRAADLEDVFSLYSGLLIQNPLVQGAITKESLYPKSLLRSRSY